MKIGLDAGHCLRGYDTGAHGCGLKEEVLTRSIVNQVSRRLQAAGHRVIICNCETAGSLRESLNYRTNKANSNNVDLYVSVHINATRGAQGTEVFTYGGRELPQARRVLNNICKFGFRNRGIKDGKHLAVIRNSHAPAMLIECFFIDTQSDVNLYKSVGSTAMGNAIADGILGVNTNNTPKKPTPTKAVSVDGKIGYCTGNQVRVRSSKTTNTNNNIIGHLNKNDKVTLFKLEGDWVHIYYPTHGGYVHKNYIKY